MHDKVLAGILRPGTGLIITDLKQVIFLMAFLIHLVSTFSRSFKFYPDIVNVFSKILFVSKMMHLTCLQYLGIPIGRYTPLSFRQISFTRRA